MYQVRGPQFYSISGLEVAAETANVSDDGRATMQMQANANTLPFGEPTADYLCLKSTADGNCLYNSISFLLKGNELASDKLRRDTARELQNHLDVYFESIERLSVELEMDVDVILFNILDETSIKGSDRKQWIKNDIRDTWKANTWSGILQIMALATVLQLPITSIWPADATGERIPLQHRVFYPQRQADDQGMQTVVKEGQETDLIIFWAKTHAARAPNHIVPVSKRSRLLEQNPHTAPSVWHRKSPNVETDYNINHKNKISNNGQQTGKGKGKKKGKKQKFVPLCSYGLG